MQMHAARVNQKEDENEEDLSGTGAGEQKHSIKTHVTHLGASVNNTQAWNLRQRALHVLNTTAATKCTRTRYFGLGKSNANIITFCSKIGYGCKRSIIWCLFASVDPIKQICST